MPKLIAETQCYRVERQHKRLLLAFRDSSQRTCVQILTPDSYEILLPLLLAANLLANLHPLS